MIEMLKGLNQLKSMGIYHRDIKPLNFLYNMAKKKGIIIDFGLAEVDRDYFEMVIKKKFEELQKKMPKTDKNITSVTYQTKK